MSLESTAASIISEMARTVNLTLGERERLKRVIISHVEPLLYQPCLSFGCADDLVKNDEQAGKMLELLKTRGTSGATNVELNRIAINHRELYT